MRILPDTRDLINLTEHDQPQAFREYLIAHNQQIVLTFVTVKELAGPLAAGANFLSIRPLLQTLEAMPHMYMKEVTIVGLEIESAVRAFTNGTEYEDCIVYVTRWDRTLMTRPGQLQGAYDNLVGLRLDEIVYDVFRSMRQVFAPPRHQLPRLVTMLQEDRDALRNGKAPARLHFIRSVKKHAASHGVQLPQEREDEFAEWIYKNPSRCPGLRLNHETYRLLMSNYGDVPQVGDFSDLALIYCVPYVEAITLDNRIREYCSSAARRLLRVGAAVDYRDRLYRNLEELMRRNP